jgi:hypothetical protein
VNEYRLDQHAIGTLMADLSECDTVVIESVENGLDTRCEVGVTALKMRVSR